MTSPHYSALSPPANIAPATAEMDRLLAEMTAGMGELKGDNVYNGRKPKSEQVTRNQQGFNENKQQKPDFQKNQVIR